MIRNKDTDVFLILTLPFYGTSSIRKQIYSGYLPETFSTHCRFMEHLLSEHRFIPDIAYYQTAANYEYILITIIFMITQLNSVYFGFTPGAGVL